MKVVNMYTHVLFEILKSFFSFLWGMVLYMPCGSPNPLMFMCLEASHMVLVVKNPPANAGDIGDMGLIPGAGRSPEGEHGNPLQYPCLEIPMDGWAWWATVHRVAKVRHDLATKPTYLPKSFNVDMTSLSIYSHSKIKNNESSLDSETREKHFGQMAALFLHEVKAKPSPELWSWES